MSETNGAQMTRVEAFSTPCDWAPSGRSKNNRQAKHIKSFSTAMSISFVLLWTLQYYRKKYFTSILTTVKSFVMQKPGRDKDEKKKQKHLIHDVHLLKPRNKKQSSPSSFLPSSPAPGPSRSDLTLTYFLHSHKSPPKDLYI